MAIERKYRVYGTFEGKRYETTVSAFSARQAKIRAGLGSGLSGLGLQGFMRSGKVRVKKA